MLAKLVYNPRLLQAAPPPAAPLNPDTIIIIFAPPCAPPCLGLRFPSRRTRAYYYVRALSRATLVLKATILVAPQRARTPVAGELSVFFVGLSSTQSQRKVMLGPVGSGWVKSVRGRPGGDVTFAAGVTLPARRRRRAAVTARRRRCVGSFRPPAAAFEARARQKLQFIFSLFWPIFAACFETRHTPQPPTIAHAALLLARALRPCSAMHWPTGATHSSLPPQQSCMPRVGRRGAGGAVQARAAMWISDCSRATARRVCARRR